MITKNNKKIENIFFGNQIIDKVYKGATLIYNSIKQLLTRGSLPLTLTKTQEGDVIDYTIYGNTIQDNRLPIEYQQVEYLEASGAQYIQIDYIATEKTNSRGKFQITNTDAANFLYGSRVSSTVANCYGLNWGGGVPYKYYNTYYGPSGVGITDLTIDGEVHTFKRERQHLWIDDNLIHSRPDTDGTLTFTTPNKMAIFACAQGNNNVITLYTQARIFSLQFLDDDVLKIDLIPCYRKADNKPGMYDLVNNIFYINQGSATIDFTMGADIINGPVYAEIFSTGNQVENGYVLPMRIENDNNALSLDIDIPLNEPLRKVDTYADYISYTNKQQVKQIKKLVLTGDEDFYSQQSIALQPVVSISKNSLGSSSSVMPDSKGTVRCSHFSPITLSTHMKNLGIIYVGLSYVNFNLDGTGDVDAFKAYAREQYNNGTPITLYYPIPTPEVTELDLPVLPIYNNTTIIKSLAEVTPSEIEVTYYGKN